MIHEVRRSPRPISVIINLNLTTIVFLSSDLKHKTTNMPTSYKQSVSTMNKSALAQESATAAPLHVSWKT